MADIDDPQAVTPVMGERIQNAIDGLLARLNWRRATHYQRLFLDDDGAPNRDGEKVLADLARFCRANETTYRPDAREHALLEGRREVFLRISKFLGMSSEEARAFVEVSDE